jgi:D-alanyl-D-alanine carboxypeptidase/D-alanyl-D-alanine-endopeptidase (penicillin-binding protein 4)
MNAARLCLSLISASLCLAAPASAQRGLPEGPRREAPSLSQRLAAVLGRAEKAGVSCGAFVQSVKGAEPAYRYREAEPLRPASNLKLLTAVHALETLGSDYQFETRFELAGDPSVLVVTSGGDPCFTDEIEGGLSVFAGLATALQERGIRSLPGGVVLDASDWEGPGRPPSWPRRHFWRSYGAPTAPFAITEGCLVTRMLPGERKSGPCPIEFVPACMQLPTEGSILLTGDRKQGGRYTIALGRDGKVELGGHFYRHATDATVRVPVEDPVALFEEALRCTLAKSGVDLSSRRDTAPAGGRETLYVHRNPLQTSLQRMLVESSNFQAEMLVRLCGRQMGKKASFADGLAVMRQRFGDLKLDSKELVIEDGSGLADSNRLSARALARVLQGAVRARYNRLFVTSLAQSGVSGTLLRRMGGKMRGAVRAKTGYINGTSSLSGFVRTEKGNTFIFVILMNWKKSSASLRELRSIQDDFVREIFENV